MLFAGYRRDGIGVSVSDRRQYAQKQTAEDKPSKTVAVAEVRAMPKGEPLAAKDISLRPGPTPS